MLIFKEEKLTLQLDKCPYCQESLDVKGEFSSKQQEIILYFDLIRFPCPLCNKNIYVGLNMIGTESSEENGVVGIEIKNVE